MANSDTKSGNKIKIQVKTKEYVETPSLYKVLMHNDDYTVFFCRYIISFAWINL